MARRLRESARTIGRAAVRGRWVAAVMVGLAFVLWLVLFAPRLLVPATSDADLRDVPGAARWQARDSRLKLQNDVRNTLLQGVGGVAVLAGALFAFRQLRVTREGQVTERYTRAIDQLGSENLDVRLGGIYALERMANDSPQDRATIAEVLTAFVRGHSPWPPTRQGQLAEDAFKYPYLEDMPTLQVRAPDVQAALTVLGRRKLPPRTAEWLDFRDTDLRRADLWKARLQEASFDGARLQGAILSEAELQKTTFAFADLHGASLERVRLQSAQLIGADLRGVMLRDAQLQMADLSHVKFDGAYLQTANLQGASIGRASFPGAHLEGADLRQTIEYEEADLRDALPDPKTRWPEGFDWRSAMVLGPPE
jgi:hypothetical protein